MALGLLLVLLAAACGQGTGQTTTKPVCVPGNDGSQGSPVRIESEFSVRIEVVAQETNRVTNLRMFYSWSRNQIRLQMLDGGVRSDTFFYFTDNEILTFDYSKGRGSCTVNTDLANAADTFIVGNVKDNAVRSPLVVLHLVGQSGFGTDISLIQLKDTQVRDMDVDSYSSCQKWQVGQQSAVFNVTHHFSKKSWARPDPPTVPVLIEIHGYGILHGQSTPINHYYNFFDFQSSIDPSDFETPPGIMCLGRNAGLPFPTAPTYMKFSGETIDATSGQVSYFEEIFSADDDFVVLRFHIASNPGTTGGMDHITIIRDYRSGLSYTINETTQICKTQNISAATPMPFDFIDQNGKVHEVTPGQLFFQTDTKYEYLGERTVRKMIADTWVTKTNIPILPNEEVTLEWYFAKPEVTSWNSGSDYYQKGHYRMPVLMRLWHHDEDGMSVDTNIYHVDYTKIMYGTINIRQCYPQSSSNFFRIFLKGASQLVINTNIDQFKWSTTAIIEDIAGVRWLRIVDMKVYFDADDAIIEFEILDAPPFASDISGTPYHGNSLQQATQKINDAIANGQMIIKVWDSSTNTITQPITAFAIGTTSTDDSGYSAGSMAGLGVAMVIIGGAGGGVGAHFFFR